MGGSSGFERWILGSRLPVPPCPWPFPSISVLPTLERQHGLPENGTLLIFCGPGDAGLAHDACESPSRQHASPRAPATGGLHFAPAAECTGCVKGRDTHASLLLLSFGFCLLVLQWNGSEQQKRHETSPPGLLFLLILFFLLFVRLLLQANRTGP